MKGHRVYLAGGFHSGWQDEVIATCPDIEFIDPRRHHLQQPLEYTSWDLQHLKQSDILFAYMESTNPVGIGLALEVGFARASGKLIVLVDEKSPADKGFARQFAIVRSAADITFEALAPAIAFISSFQR